MGLKKNVVYNTLLTTSNYIISLVTFPYITRILGVANLGKVDFVTNVVSFFLLFSTMGIGIVGVREIAKSRNNQATLNSTFSSLLFLNLIYTIITFVIYIVFIFINHKYIDLRVLFIIGSLQILFNLFLVEWFFRGLEQFSYITVRTIILKIIYTILVFTLIKDSEDYNIYYILTTGLLIVNSVVNIIYARRFVNFSINVINVKKYLKNTLLVGIYSIMTSMYTTFNVAFLGFTHGTTEVGYYSTALKFYTIILGVYTAVSTAMLPRGSYLISEKRINEFNTLINKTFALLFSITVPLIIFSEFFSNELILIIAGSGYDLSVPLFRIIIPLVIVVGIAQILAFQIIIPYGKDQIIVRASLIGAILGVISNIALVPRYGAYGTCLVLIISELAVTLSYIFIARKEHIFIFPLKLLIKYILIGIPYIVIVFALNSLINNIYFVMLISMSLFLFYFIFIEFKYNKTGVICNILNRFRTL